MHIWYGAFGRQHCMNIHHDSLEPREFLWCPSTSIALFYFPKHWNPSDWQWDIHLLQVWLSQLCITQRHKLSDKLVYILELITTAETLESWNSFLTLDDSFVVEIHSLSEAWMQSRSWNIKTDLRLGQRPWDMQTAGAHQQTPKQLEYAAPKTWQVMTSAGSTLKVSSIGPV